MRALLRRLGAFYAKHELTIDMVLITAGAAAVKRRLEAVHGRLAVLEERGLVPMDDVVTLRDMAKVEAVLRAHHGVLSDAGLLPDDVQAQVEPEAVEEAPDGPEEPASVHAAAGPQEGEEAP